VGGPLHFFSSPRHPTPPRTSISPPSSRLAGQREPGARFPSERPTPPVPGESSYLRPVPTVRKAGEVLKKAYFSRRVPGGIPTPFFYGRTRLRDLSQGGVARIFGEKRLVADLFGGKLMALGTKGASQQDMPAHAAGVRSSSRNVRVLGQIRRSGRRSCARCAGFFC